MADIYRTIDSLNTRLKYLNNLIPVERANEIFKELNELKTKSYVDNYTLSDGEKCLLLLEQYVQSNLAPQLTLFPEEMAAIREITPEIVKELDLISPEPQLCPNVFLHFANTILKKQEIINEITNDESVSSEIKEIVLGYKENEKEYDFQALHSVLQDLGIFKALLTAFAKTVDNERFEKKHNETECIYGLRASKLLHDKYEYEYNLWQASTQEIALRHAIFNELDSLRFYNKLLYPYYCIIDSFLAYERAYSNTWIEHLLFLLENLSEPEHKIGLIRFLNLSPDAGGSPYVDEFCDTLEDYCAFIQKKTPIDLSLVQGRVPPVFDDDSNHKEWYVRIPYCKVPANNIILIRRLRRLYKGLVKEGWIEDGYEGTFIYRLSGLGIPIAPSAVSLNWKGTDRLLGFLAIGLFQYTDEQTKKRHSPPFIEISALFGRAGNNLATANGQNSSNKSWRKVHDLLKHCMFNNIDVL